MGDPSKIVVAGDWHASTYWACKVIDQAAEELRGEDTKVILHCGDFGAWPFARDYMRVLEKRLGRHGMEVWFVDGNHEDHNFLALHDPDDDGRVHIADGVFWLPRGYRWQWHGKTWLAMGGAVSPDQDERRRGVDWFPEEEIQLSQLLRAEHDGPADVLVTHDAPTSVSQGFMHKVPPPPSWWREEILEQSRQNQLMLDHLVDVVQPSHLFHGHWHTAYRQTIGYPWGSMEAVSLSEEDTPGNWIVQNIDEM